MQPSLRAINVFVNVVRLNSFAAAARALFIDPAAVSRTIKELEEKLGVALFVRSTRVLRLTEDGALFHRDCLEILDKVEQATNRFRTEQALPRGRLRVGMGIGLPRRMLIRAIPNFHTQFPQIETVLLSVDGLAEVRQREIDVLIRGRGLRQRGSGHPAPQGLVIRKLCQAPFVLSASPEYLERAGQPRTPHDLLGHSCIAHISLERDVQTEWQFVKARARINVKFAPKLMVHGIDALREAALAGCGIIRSNPWTIDDEISSGRLLHILPEWETPTAPPLVAIYRKSRPMLPQVTAFVRYVATAFRRYDS
jgi:LysR family transcriptional regulator for bpeEF and oprC